MSLSLVVFVIFIALIAFFSGYATGRIFRHCADDFDIVGTSEGSAEEKDVEAVESHEEAVGEDFVGELTAEDVIRREG